MARHYTNGLEVPEPKKHRDLPISDVLKQFMVMQVRGQRNHEAEQKAPKPKTQQQWMPEDLS